MYDTVIRFPSPENRCRLIAGVDSVRKIGDVLGEVDYSSAFVITDRNVHRFHERRIETIKGKSRILILPSGETTKNYRMQAVIQSWLLKKGADRQSILIGIGGGVMCDIVGFAAATFMRGIRHALIPTTLVAQIDASIGGKNGINLPNAKNIVGTIRQPVSIVVDPTFLETLLPRHMKEGMSELIKMALIRSRKLSRQIESYQSTRGKSADDLIADMVEQGVRLKLDVVRKDPHEKGLRKILNFGHTTAHALEVLGRYGRMTHGRAVAFGMLVALELSEKLCSLDRQTIDEAETIIRSLYRSFPVQKFSSNDVWDVIKRDKKRVEQQVQFVLLESMAKPVVRDVMKSEFSKAYTAVLKQWSSRT